MLLPGPRPAFHYVNELREIADQIERCPEIADQGDLFDAVIAASRLLDELDGLDHDLYDVEPDDDED